MSIIGRLGANNVTYPYVRCDVSACGKEAIIEGITVANKNVRGNVDAFDYPRGWASVTIVTSKAELNYDGCCASHVLRLFARKLQDALT